VGTSREKLEIDVKGDTPVRGSTELPAKALPYAVASRAVAFIRAAMRVE
jgi:hypothetical protein